MRALVIILAAVLVIAAVYLAAQAAAPPPPPPPPPPKPKARSLPQTIGSGVLAVVGGIFGGPRGASAGADFGQRVL